MGVARPVNNRTQATDQRVDRRWAKKRDEQSKQDKAKHRSLAYEVMRLGGHSREKDIIDGCRDLPKNK